MKIHIGIQSARELEFEVDDGDAIIAQLAEAKEWMVWLTDAKGHRHGIVVESVAFVEVESPEGRQVGFGL